MQLPVLHVPNGQSESLVHVHVRPTEGAQGGVIPYRIMSVGLEEQPGAEPASEVVPPPQSAQSVPGAQSAVLEPGRPSSHSRSNA
jgi:hypothetical protein